LRTDAGDAAGLRQVLRASEHLDGGFRYEQAGMARKAVAAYEAALAAGADPAERAEAQLRLARAHRTNNDWDAAIAEARVAVRLAEEAGSPDLVAEAMNVEVGVYQLRGEWDAGDALARAALNVAHSPRVRGILLQNRGAIAAQRADFTAATELFNQSMDAFEAAGYELGMAIALNNASAAARDAGDPAHSLTLAVRAAAVARRLSAYDVLTLAAQNQAHALVALGRADEAEAPLGEVLGHFTATCNVLRQAECLEIMGVLHHARSPGDGTAERCFELAQSLGERVGSSALCTRVARRLSEVRTGGQGMAGIAADAPQGGA